MTIAKIANGVVVEIRDYPIHDIDFHQAHSNWRPVIDDFSEGPDYDPRYQTIEGPIYDVQEMVVYRSWNRSDIDPAILQDARVQDAWKMLLNKISDYYVIVPINGVDYKWGCDSESQENIIGINLAIAMGVNVPNPRPWTPKGEVTPVMCSYDDLKTIGTALLAAKDAFMAVYFTHKAAIKTSTDSHFIAYYDVSTGWPTV